MSDGQLLYLILWLIYLSDCFQWIRFGTVMLVNPWSRQWQVQRSVLTLQSHRGRLAMVNPFPPLGRFILPEILPLSISPRGIASVSMQTLERGISPVKTANILGFEEIISLEFKDSWLVINESRFCRFADPGVGRQVIELLERIKALPEDQREEPIREFWANRLDIEKLDHELTGAWQEIADLQILSNLLFVITFVAAPVAAQFFGASPLIVPVAILMFLMAYIITGAFFRCHRKLFPDNRWDRWEQAFKMVMCPPMAIRSADLLMRLVGRSHDAMAVISLVMKHSRGKQLLQRIIRDLHHPMSPAVDDDRLETIGQWQNQVILDVASEKIPEFADLIPEALETPEKQADECKLYCPRCRTQFVVERDTCPDCVGVMLKPLMADIDSDKIHDGCAR